MNEDRMKASIASFREAMFYAEQLGEVTEDMFEQLFARKPPIGIMPLWLWKEKHPNPTFEDIANRGYEIIAARKRGAKID